MPSNLKLKYEMMHHRVHLKDGEPLGLIVTSDWKHRYMIVKGVRPNSISERLGIQRDDRLFALDHYIGEKLTMKVMSAVVTKKRHFVLTTLRKKSLCPKPSPVRSSPKRVPVKGTRLNFANAQTYCIKSAQPPFSVYEDQMEAPRNADEPDEVMMDFDEVSEKCETCDLRTEEERDWDAVSLDTCLSGQEHFHEQRMERMEHMRVKMGDITNKEGNYQNVAQSSIIQADLKALQERSDKCEQFMRRYRVTNIDHCPINRVADWVDLHSTSHHSNAVVSEEENKENVMPTNIWMKNWLKSFE